MRRHLPPGPPALPPTSARTGAACRSGARPVRSVKGVEGDSCEGRIGVGVVHASLGGDGQADHQRRCGDGQSRRDPKAYPSGHRDLLQSMYPGSGIIGGSKPQRAADGYLIADHAGHGPCLRGSAKRKRVAMNLSRDLVDVLGVGRVVSLGAIMLA
jgi:hypothetical protein